MIAKPSMWWPGIRSGHPLARGIVAAWPMWEGGGGRLSSLASPARTAGTFHGSVWGGSPYGPTVKHDTTTDYVDFGASSFLPTAGFTAALLYRKTDGTDRNSTAFGVATGVAAGLCDTFVPWGDGIVYFRFGGTGEPAHRISEAWTSDTDWHHWVFSCGSRGMEINLDNAILDSNATNPTRTSTTDGFRLGTSSAAADLADTALLIIASRQWNFAEISEWNDDPFGLITPRQRTYFFYLVRGVKRGFLRGVNRGVLRGAA